VSNFVVAEVQRREFNIKVLDFSFFTSSEKHAVLQGFVNFALQPESLLKGILYTWATSKRTNKFQKVTCWL